MVLTTRLPPRLFHNTLAGYCLRQSALRCATYNARGAMGMAARKWLSIRGMSAGYSQNCRHPVLKYFVPPIAAILAHWAANSFIFDSHVIAPVGAHYRRRHLFRTFGQSRELQRAIFD